MLRLELILLTMMKRKIVMIIEGADSTNINNGDEENDSDDY